jgi:hypothetical protein
MTLYSIHSLVFILLFNRDEKNSSGGMVEKYLYLMSLRKINIILTKD